MEPETTPEDDFANAFAALNTPADPAPADPAPADPAPADPAPADPAPTDPAPVDPAPVDPAPADPAPVDPAPAPAAPDVSAEIAGLKAQIEALKTAAPAASPAPADPDPAPAAVYTPEEQASIDAYRAAWPDIQAGEALVRRAEYRELVGYIFEQVRGQLDPALTFYQSQQGRTQYSDIVSLVPDYDAVRDKTLAWVDTQPEYLKKAYQEVANTGSASDVADLINRFKKDTGYAAPAAAAVPPAAALPAAAAAPPAAALPAAAAAAVSGLRVVKSGRAEPAAAADPNDFDSAFVEFTKTR